MMTLPLSLEKTFDSSIDSEMVDIVDADGDSIAEYLWKDDAEQIVHAVNFHAELLAACKAALPNIERFVKPMGDDLGLPTSENYLVKQIASAIAKAKGA